MEECIAHHVLHVAGVDAAAGAVRADQHHGRVVRRRRQEQLRVHAMTGMRCCQFLTHLQVIAVMCDV